MDIPQLRHLLTVGRIKARDSAVNILPSHSNNYILACICIRGRRIPTLVTSSCASRLGLIVAIAFTGSGDSDEGGERRGGDAESDHFFVAGGGCVEFWLLLNALVISSFHR